MSGMDVLRERITRALWDNRYPGYLREGALWNLYLTDADAVIAALGLVEEQGPTTYAYSPSAPFTFTPRRRYVTPWERIEDDA